jgi:hypothetical protein
MYLISDLPMGHYIVITGIARTLEPIPIPKSNMSWNAVQCRSARHQKVYSCLQSWLGGGKKDRRKKDEKVLTSFVNIEHNFEGEYFLAHLPTGPWLTCLAMYLCGV